MNLRRGLAWSASGILLLLLLWRKDPRELLRRGRTLARSAGMDLAVRRLHGSGTAQDRQFFAFLESARHALPPGTPGVAIVGAPSTDFTLYLATYQLAPTPVLVAAPRVPPGWLLAIYGPQRPAGWRVVAPISGGALMGPA